MDGIFQLASNNFLKALERIPVLLEKYKADSQKLDNDIPILKEVISSVFKKEPELRNLKLQLDSLSRQINLSLSTNRNQKQQSEIIADKEQNRILDISDNSSAMKSTENRIQLNKGLRL